MNARHILIIIVIAAILIGVGLYSKKRNAQQQERKDAALHNLETFQHATIAGEVFNFNKEEKIAATSTPPLLKEKPISAPVTTAQAVSEHEGLCGGASAADFFCYEAYFRDRTIASGVKSAFARLREEYAKNNYVVAQCHPLAHVIGRAATTFFKTVGEAYRDGDSFCWSGYYHGVMEGVLGKVGYSGIKEALPTMCADLAKERQYSFDHYNCVHGLGHGVMVLNNNELFDALVMCDGLGDAWERSSCWSGVFMENIIIDNKNHFTKFLKPEDPLYPCNAVQQEYKGTCYLMQTSYMLKVGGMDFAKVFKQCAEAEPDFRHVCYQSLGRDASGQSVSNAERTKATCLLGADFEQQSNCFIGAVKDFISYYHGDTEARALCQLLEDAKVRDVCFQTAENYVKVL